MTIQRLSVPAILVALIGGGILLASRTACRDDTPATEGPIQVVPDKVLERERPKPLTPVAKVFRRRIPAKVTVTEGRPDTTRIRRFANLVRERDSLQAVLDSLKKRKAAGDTTAKPELVRMPRPILPPSWGRYDGRHFSWTITQSDGNLKKASVRVRPHFEFYSGIDAGSDTVPVIQGDRWLLAMARRVPGCGLRSAPMAGLGALVDRDDRVRGAIIAGTSALIGCLAG